MSSFKISPGQILRKAHLILNAELANYVRTFFEPFLNFNQSFSQLNSPWFYLILL